MSGNINGAGSFECDTALMWQLVARRRECNFGGDSRASAYVVANLPADLNVVYIGFEAGIQILTGAALTGCASANNPCRAAYINFLGPSKGRPSWDPLAALIAVRGTQHIPAVHECSNCRGRPEMNQDHSTWSHEDTNHKYILIQHEHKHEAAAVIDDLLCKAQPIKYPPRATSYAGLSIITLHA